jgi:hypothetical protein
VTWALLLALGLGGGVAVCFLLGRRNALPADLEAWHHRLCEDSARVQATLELQVKADGAMSRDALRRAQEARQALSYEEAIRLVDVAFGVLEGATTDRVTRLRGMAACFRMASAVLPTAPVGRVFRLREVRALMTAGAIVHHLLVSAVERLLLKLLLLRFAYRLTLRAMRGGVEKIHVDPTAEEAWARCDAAVSDWTEGLDPEHVEAFRVMLASAVVKKAA